MRVTLPHPVANGISAAAQAGATLGSAALVYRIAGPQALGVWSVLVALRGIVVFVEGGLALGVTRDAALEAAGSVDARSRIRAATRLYAGLAVTALAIGIAGAGVPGAVLGLRGAAAGEAAIATAIVALETALVLIASPLLGIVRGRERFDLLAVGSTGYGVGGLMLVAAGTVLWGVAGAAAGSAVARALITLAYFAWVRRNAARVLSAPSRGMGTVIRFAAPIWLISVGTQIGLRLQVPIVGGFFGAVSAGHFAAGSTLATLAAGFLWVLIDTAYPSLARAPEVELRRRLPGLLLLGTLMGTAGFTTIILHAEALVRAWLGDSPDVAVMSLQLFAVGWLINVPTHVLVVVAMSRGRHHALAPVVIIETVALVGASLVLPGVLGPSGPALAMVLVYAVTNLVAVPIVLVPRLGVSWTQLARSGAGGAFLGGAGAALLWAALRPFSLDPVMALLISAAGLGVAGLLLLRNPAVRAQLG